jgi:hypothetical protein
MVPTATRGPNERRVGYEHPEHAIRVRTDIDRIEERHRGDDIREILRQADLTKVRSARTSTPLIPAERSQAVAGIRWAERPLFAAVQAAARSRGSGAISNTAAG